MNGLKKTLSIMLCVAMIASGSFMAFAEGESNPQNVTVVEGENAGENVGGEEGGNEGNEGENVDENKEENKDEDKQQSEALLAAIGALNNLPLFDSLTEDTDADALLAQVQAARAAYDALTEEEKLLVEEAKLNNLLDLEFFFENRPSNTPADAPVDQVVATQSETETADLTGEGTQANPYQVSSVEELKEAVGLGGYITLNQNITITEEIVISAGSKNSDSTVLNLGTCKIEGNTGAAALNVQANVTLVGGEIKNNQNGVRVASGSLQVSGTKITGTVNGGVSVTGGTVVINDGTAITGYNFGVGLLGSGTELTVNGGNISATGFGIAGNGSNDGTTITVKGGSILGEQACAIYHPQEGSLTIEGGNLTGLTGVQYCGAGQLTISGGTIRGTAPYTQFPSKPAEQGDGSADDGAAVSIISRGDGYQSEGSEITVSITGGNLISDNNAAVTSYRLQKVEDKWQTNDATQVSNYLTGLTIGSGASLKGSDAKGTLELDAEVEKTAVTIENGATFVPSKGVDQYLGDDQAVGEDGSVGDLQTNGAAKIGDKVYATLKEAIENVQSGDTIYVLRNVSDAQGISVPSNSNFTIDFQNHTYTLKDPGAGSAGTETNGFQLLKGSKITMKNGTIRIAQGNKNIKRIIQNYADLTLENMTFYAENQVEGENLPLSFNNGNIVFKGNTSIYTSSNDNFAFDVCKFRDYPSATVTFDESYTGTINGKILYDAPDANTHKLIIKGNGTFGEIVASSGNESAAKDAIEISGGRFTAPVNKDYLADGYHYQLYSNDRYYSYHPTLEDAKNAAKPEGGTITDLNNPTQKPVVVPPSPNAPEKPNSNSGSTGSSSTVQQMEEREKPDPADKKAMEEYNFWMQVKSKIRATAEGKTLRITVKEGIEYMPASVMQTLYECKVGITLYWDGVTIEIPVGKAQPKQALRVYWTKTKLMDLYNA